MFILTNGQIKRIEEKANAQGLSFKAMMEKAGNGCAEFILNAYPKLNNIVILCGKGKNGGDGFVIARALFNAGKTVKIIRVFSEPSDWLSDSNLKEIPEGVRVSVFSEDIAGTFEVIENADIIVDAVFGIGFKGTMPKTVEAVINEANLSEAVRIAVDMPSGLAIGQTPDENVFNAHHTLSMMALKYEHIYEPYRNYCGDLHIIPIGINIRSSVLPFSMTCSEAKYTLPRRQYNSNKGSFGKALIIAGSRNMPGAAVIATKGALSTGVGLTQLAYPDVCECGILPKLTENIFLPLKTSEDGEISAENIPLLTKTLSECSACAIGCGMGKGENSKEVVLELIKSSKVPLVIDADGINIIAEHKDVLKEASCPVLITPHPGEMSRLTNTDVKTVNSSREQTASAFAKRYNVYVLLKGANTVVAAPDGKIYINPTGGTALSRGGSGDLLTGITVSMISQGITPFEALCTAAFIHGLAGDISGKKFTPYASTVERITEQLPDAFLKITESKW